VSSASARAGARTTLRRYVAFLRAVNVGGAGLLDMARLRRWAETLGLEQPRTFLTTGNLLFGASERSSALESMLERGAPSGLGFATAFVVRDVRALDRALGANPFPEAARTDPAHLVVVFLKRPASKASFGELVRAHRGPETMHLDGTHLYAVYPEGIARSRLTLPRIEAALGTLGTARNWNTVTRLARLSVKE
jgi:uncharacterized protein (DUF1697 family)